MRYILAVILLASAAPAMANDWQKFYRPIPSNLPTIPWDADAEVVSLDSNLEAQRNQMFTNGFLLVGYSEFNSGNAKIADAVKLAKSLHARYIAVSARLVSSNTVNVPITTPTTNTSITSGNIYGRGAAATFNSTTTTYGAQTTDIPITVNRFQKQAVFYAKAADLGTGILPRNLAPAEVAQFETQKGFVVEAVRVGSPAYRSDILPGDVVLLVNGAPFDLPALKAAIASGSPFTFGVVRASGKRDITMTVPLGHALP